jgi:methylated-DNA-[protein]-cysteine S-methyltransferase
MLTLAEFGSPLGPLSVAECKERILAVHFGDTSSLLEHYPALLDRPCRTSAPLGPAGRNLRDYLAGRIDAPHAKVDLTLVGSDFDRLVLKRLYRTRAGQTLSYGDLAREVGKPTAARAVGGAMRRNPIPILIPCHRVVTSLGTLGHYTGGVDKKEWLLAFEGVQLRAA